MSIKKDINLVGGNMDDYDFYYKLKSEPTNIYWAGYKDKPDYEVLKKWYIDKVINKQYEFKFIEYCNEKVGVIYFKAEGRICQHYGISVSDKFAGKGIAAAAVKTLGEYIYSNYNECEKLIVLIREDNLASIRVHEKSGVKRTGKKIELFIEAENKNIVMEEWELKIR